MVDTGGTEWHSSNRGVSIYICLYLSLLVIVVTLSVRALAVKLVGPGAKFPLRSLLL